jgi:uncharacterized protein (TIGR02246 family)
MIPQPSRQFARFPAMAYPCLPVDGVDCCRVWVCEVLDRESRLPVEETRMKNRKTRLPRLSLACVMLLSACKSATPSSATAALHVVERWATAFRESNVDAIVSLYAPDASFFGTGSKTLVTTPAQIRSYFETALQRDKPRGAELREPSVRVASENVVIVTGLDRVSGTKDGSVYSTEGRVTFVIEKRGEDWQIVHFHRSAMPR